MSSSLPKKDTGDEMNEKTVTIDIHDLEISDKSKRLLTRMGLMQLNDLLRCDMTELSRTHNISHDVFQELNGVIAYAEDIVRFFAERGERISGILPDVQEMPIESLGLGTRTVNAFEHFRNKMRNACSGCDKKALCMGGCPLMPEIVFCNSEKRHIEE